MTCILLGINRLFEMCWPSTAEILFHGNRIYIWLIIPPIYTLFSFTQLPGVYNKKHYAFYFDPFFDTEFGGMPEFSNLTFHCTHNIGTIVFLIIIYTTLVIKLAVTYKKFGSVDVSRLQKLASSRFRKTPKKSI